MLTTEVYQTSDLKIHNNEKKALKHQVDILGELLDDFLPNDNKGNVTRSDRFNLLIKQMTDKELFNKIQQLNFVVSYMLEKRISVDDVNNEAKKV